MKNLKNFVKFFGTKQGPSTRSHETPTHLSATTTTKRRHLAQQAHEPQTKSCSTPPPSYLKAHSHNAKRAQQTCRPTRHPHSHIRSSASRWWAGGGTSVLAVYSIAVALAPGPLHTGVRAARNGTRLASPRLGPPS